MMPLQRACGAESQARIKLSNGPLRVQRKCEIAKYSVTYWHTSVAKDMMVSYKEHGLPVNSRWHRG